MTKLLPFLLTASFIFSSCSKSENDHTNGLKPKHFPKISFPKDNPQKPEAVALGKELFFDKILSVDETISCSSCHVPETSFSDENRFSKGINDQLGTRQSMAVVNLAWGKNFFWDGRAASLEEQALGPVENPIEMGELWPNVIIKLQNHSEYPAKFEAVFGNNSISKENVAKAIAQFERTLVSASSKYDKHLTESEPLTEEEQQGKELFFSEKSKCSQCHGTILFTDDKFHNNGLDTEFADLGLGEITELKEDEGKFKTPTLRNIELTAPYMHDGRFRTLAGVIEHYNSGLKQSDSLAPVLNNAEPLGLTLEEKIALLAFLKTLTDTEF